MKLIEIFQKYSDPQHTGCFTFWHEAAPHITYDLDAAEGVRFWAMNSETDDLDEAKFGAALIFSDGWEIEIQNGAYVNIEFDQAGIKKVTSIPHLMLPEVSPMVKAAEEFMRIANEQVAKMCGLAAGSICGYVAPKPDGENEFQTIELGSTDHPMLSMEPNCATGESCQMGPHGPDGSIQCQYCGAEPESPTKAFDTIPLDLGRDWKILKAEKPRKADDDVVKFLAGAIGCVEANSFEKMSLYCDRGELDDDWKDNGSGYGICVGQIANQPVYVNITSAVINGHKIIFYYGQSVLVDNGMILDWMKENMPETAFKNDRLNTVDAMNFHNVLPHG